MKFVVLALVLLLLGSCSSIKPASKQEQKQLEEARQAAESAVRKLSELQAERRALEQEMKE